MPHRALEGQRRQATVLFADMAAFTPLAERLGEEKTYLLIQRALHTMSQAVHAHEGTVQELTGDGLMALFGVPIADESAPLEACKAALDIQSRMLALEDELERELGLRPKYRIGIHTGPLHPRNLPCAAARVSLNQLSLCSTLRSYPSLRKPGEPPSPRPPICAWV
jgi:class 3 adenylate cyclase